MHMYLRTYLCATDRIKCSHIGPFDIGNLVSRFGIAISFDISSYQITDDIEFGYTEYTIIPNKSIYRVLSTVLYY